MRESSAEILSGTHNVRQTRLYGGDYSGRRDGGAVSPAADIVTICTARCGSRGGGDIVEGEDASYDGVL